jgi:hypothetical protein
VIFRDLSFWKKVDIDGVTLIKMKNGKVLQ